MRPRRLLPSRSAAEWAGRGACALVVVLIGLAAVTHSFAAAVARRQTVLAHSLAPYDGQITARLAEQRFRDQPTGDTRSAAARLARLAVRQDATTIPAIVTLGLQAQLRGDVAGARRLFGYSQQLSRRDFGTQLWAIEDAVARGDVDGALRHYDIALRTTKSAPDVLFPVLAPATSDPAIRRSLTRTLSAQPVWTKPFIDYLTTNSADPRAMASLFIGLRRDRVPVSAEADAATITALLARASDAEAWRYYAAIRPGVDRRRSRDAEFQADLSTPSAFDWVAAVDPNLGAAFQRGVNGGVLNFATSPSAGGVLVKQLQLLPPGRYRLAGHSSGIAQSIGTQPYWTLTCRDGRELGRLVVPNSARAGGSFGGVFSVPPGCPVQTLALMAPASDDIAGVTGQIDRAQLSPVG